MNIRVEENLTTSEIPVLGNINESLKKRSFNLPKIELKKFNGDAEDYLTLLSQFQKIRGEKIRSMVTNSSSPLQAVVLNSREAARVVKSFTATDANHQQAINQMQERFGRKDFLFKFTSAIYKQW